MTPSDFDTRIEALKVQIITLKLQGADLAKDVRIRFAWNTLNYELKQTIWKKEKWRRRQLVADRQRRKYLLKNWRSQQWASAESSKKPE